MQAGQLLTQGTKDRRLLNSTKLLNKLKHPKESNMLWFFSDEKNFSQDQAHNRQNHQWIAMWPNDVPRVIKTKFPNVVMIFGVISSDRDVISPHIFETGLSINTEIYLQVMETVVLPWIEQVAQDTPWIWQHDSAPCHVFKHSLAWLEEHCYNFLTKDKWPPSSLDLNPMDFFFGAFWRIKLTDALIPPRHLSSPPSRKNASP